MKHLILLIPLLALGCAQPTVKVNIPEIQQSSSLIIKDLRPTSEKENKIFSLSITSSAYGTYRKGEETLNPPMSQILRHRAFEKFKSSAQPLVITLHHMVVYYNAKSALRKGAMGGLIGAAIASGAKVNLLETLADRTEFERLANDEYKRALYTEKENPEKASVFVIYIDAELNGKRTFVKTMAPDKTSDNQNAYASAVEGAIKYFLNQY